MLGIWILIAYTAVRNAFAAASRPFWYDEILALIVTRQHGLSGIWNALAHAVDSQPPPFYLLERAAGALLPNPHIAFRLPSILGFACILLCVFLFVERRSGRVYALICVAMLLISVLYNTDFMEARPYELFIACIGIALVCYQRAPETHWVILMGASLAAAEAFHYYAVFALVPFGIAEIALSLKTHRLRIGVWFALACGLLPLALFWPLLLALKRYYSPHIWNPAILGHAGRSYAWFFNRTSHDWNLAVAAVVVLVILGALVALAFRNTRAALTAEPYFHEYVLVWALLGLPFVTFIAVKLSHGGFDQRYVLPAVLAFPLGAGYILPQLNRYIAIFLVIPILCLFTVHETRFWNAQRGHFGKVVSPADSVERVVSAAGYPDLPVVVSDGHDYLQMAYYASPEWASRFVAIVDPAQAVAYTGSDSVDKNQLAVRTFYPLQVHEFQDFAPYHPRFLLYSSGAPFDWWPGRLRNNGYSLELVATDGDRRVFLVSRSNL